MPAAPIPTIDDELDVLAALLALDGQRIIELGCGAVALARALVLRHPGNHVTGVEVNARQHAKNLAAPQPGLDFGAGVAQAIPFPNGRFDLALMLKSLHHVPLDAQAQAQALREVARVLCPGGHLYVSEPVYAEHPIDDAKLAQTRAAFEPHCGADGAHFNRPMHARVLRRIG